jgi:4-amino-4-deoxy-L-arabinose transferase-like glycosyltransferase
VTAVAPARLRSALAAGAVPRPLAIALGVGLALRLGLVFGALFEPGRFYSPDSDRYLRLASNLYEGYVQRSSPLFDLGLERPPGYPLFLWATGGTHHPAFVVAAQVVLGLVMILLTYRLGRHLFDERAATAASFIVAVDPNMLAHGNFVVSETLFTVMVLGSVAVLLLDDRRAAPRRCLAGGLLLGLAVLVRPIALLVPAVLLPALWFWWSGSARQRLAAALALLLGFGFPVGAWTVRNAVVTGVPLVSTVLGSELLYSGAGSAVQEEKGQVSLREEGNPVTGPVEEPTDAGRNDAERSRSRAGAALRLIRDHPVGMTKALARGAARTLLGPGQSVLLNTMFGRPRPGDEILVLPPGLSPVATRGVLGVQVAFLVLLYAGVATGAVKLAMERRLAVLGLLLVLVLYFGLSAPGLAGYARYRVPCTPYLALLAGVGYGLLALQVRRSRLLAKAQ